MGDWLNLIIAVVAYTIGFFSGQVDRKNKSPKYEWLCLRENCKYRIQASDRTTLEVKVEQHRDFHRDNPGARYE